MLFVPSAFLTLTVWGLAAAQITTSQYNNGRTGANLNETALTPKNVNTNAFGKLFTLNVDGDVYAQPLYLPSLRIPGKGTHDVLFVATEHDTVYAFDAANNPAAPLWKAGFTNGRQRVSPVPAASVDCSFISPESVSPQHR